MIEGYDLTATEEAIKFFSRHGLSNTAIAGILGNLYAESRVMPVRLQTSYVKKLGMSSEEYMIAVDNKLYTAFNTDRAGWGIYQLTSEGRKAGFYNYCEINDLSIGSLNAQLEYLWYELTTSYRKKVLDVLTEPSTTVYQAAEVVVCKFEIPASVTAGGVSKENTIKVRAGYAEEFYNKYFAQNTEVKPVSKTIKIMLDAGHDGKRNQSPVFKNYYESDFTFKWQTYLKADLEKYGFYVGVTRTSQNEVEDVVDRGMDSKGYDFFISGHSNACSTESVDRVSGIFLAKDDSTGIDEISEQVSILLTDVVKTTMGITSASQNYYKLAGYDRNGNGITTDDDYYGVLYGAHKVKTPGIILEHSFHTNKRSAQWLYNDANVKKLAAAEAKALADYFNMNTVITVEPDDVTNTVIYKVVKGDTLSKIAKAYNTTVDAIQALNPCILNKNIIGVGWKLTIPVDVNKPVVNLKIGDKVMLVSDATYYNGKQIPMWVRKSTLYYRGENKNGCIISTLKIGAITGVVERRFLQLV